VNYVEALQVNRDYALKITRHADLENSASVTDIRESRERKTRSFALKLADDPLGGDSACRNFASAETTRRRDDNYSSGLFHAPL